MDPVTTALDNVLSLLPFDGDKTTLGLAAHALIPLLVGLFPATAVIAPAVSAVATALIGLGVLHKAVKATK